MVQINWLPSAILDLKEIAEYISRDSTKYSSRRVEKVISKVENLESHMRMGKIVPEYENPQILEIQEGNCRIIYKIKSVTELDIVLIHHGARRLPRINK